MFGFVYERDGADVLRGTTLTVPEGSLFAVVGATARGKSTMLRYLRRCAALSREDHRARATAEGVEEGRAVPRRSGSASARSG